MKPVLAAFIESAEVAKYTSFFKADCLAAFGAFFPHQAMLGLMAADGISGKVSVFQHARNGMGDGQHQSTILKNWMLTANSL